jgi:cytochrome c-type biogenesis protein CcsB
MLTLAYVLSWAALALYALSRIQRASWAEWAGTASAGAGCLVLTAGLVLRARAAGHWPLSNRYEFALCFTWALLAVGLLLIASTREQRCGAWVTLVGLVVFTYAMTRPAEEQALLPLTPALRSTWLQVHGLTAAVGYGACGVAAGLGLMGLFRPAGMRAEDWPSDAWIERATTRAVGLGFPWLTLSILSGAMWAEAAWGRFWGWDPKETWSLVVWLGYLLFLHLRSMRGWRGKRLAWVAVGAFALLLFGFAGLPWLVRAVRLETLHGF